MDVEQNLEMVRQGYAAFAAGDMESLMALYNDDAVHVVPGSSRVSGAHKGKDSILGLYAALFELSGGSLRVQLDHVLSDGGSHVIAFFIRRAWRKTARRSRRQRPCCSHSSTARSPISRTSSPTSR